MSPRPDEQTTMPATANPAVDPKQVTGRRTVRFETYDDLIDDAERLAAGPVRTLGNWTYPQVLEHLSASINAMIDGPGFMLPAPIRPLMRLMMKRKMLTQTLEPGFKFPKSVAARFEPSDSAELGTALDALRAAVERAKADPQRALHPAFGRMRPGEWDAFQLRHCELHMSFVVPA